MRLFLFLLIFGLFFAFSFTSFLVQMEENENRSSYSYCLEKLDNVLVIAIAIIFDGYTATTTENCISFIFYLLWSIVFAVSQK